MSNKANTGGPAFPEIRIRSGDNYNPPTRLYYPGMTLRDYFAAKAMQGFVAAWGQHDVTDFMEIAHDAYNMADAMLHRRDVA